MERWSRDDEAALQLLFRRKTAAEAAGKQPVIDAVANYLEHFGPVDRLAEKLILHADKFRAVLEPFDNVSGCQK